MVGREEAFDRIKAAVDAREAGADILILARTDARHEHGLDEAMERAQRFYELGADILFVEAPADEAEMRRIGSELPGYQMANILEGGQTACLFRGIEISVQIREITSEGLITKVAAEGRAGLNRYPKT